MLDKDKGAEVEGKEAMVVELLKEGEHVCRHDRHDKCDPLSYYN